MTYSRGGNLSAYSAEQFMPNIPGSNKGPDTQLQGLINQLANMLKGSNIQQNQRPRIQNSAMNENRPPVTCYGCGQVGHVRWNCPQNNNNSGTVNTGNNSNGGVGVRCYRCGELGHFSKNCLQNNHNNGGGNNNRNNSNNIARGNNGNNNNNQQTSHAMVADVVTNKTVKLMLPVETKKQKTMEGTGVAMEIQSEPGSDSRRRKEPNHNNGEGSKEMKKKPARKPARKKRNVTQPPISNLIQPYSVVTDIKKQKADITFGQLFQAVPKLRSELSKSLRTPQTRRTRK
jgi:hypothetical protein